LAPRLLAAFGSQRDRYGSAEEVQKHSGIAPVMERSGKKKWVHFRWACPKFLRQSFHEWAGHSISQSAWARAYYQQQRGRGKDHHAAVRALAFKWIRILYRCWQDRVAYPNVSQRGRVATKRSSSRRQRRSRSGNCRADLHRRSCWPSSPRGFRFVVSGKTHHSPDSLYSATGLATSSLSAAQSCNLQLSVHLAE
jgi:hypothetical protein